ncbi:MAG: glycosyltransferase family 87 protein [Alphaproteobacteria bacterium]|nr:glycosyltransferase family 87 protein [Alphaproteobacteria bacterium]
MQDTQRLSILGILRRRMGSADMLVAVSRILVVEYVLGLSIWYALANGLKDLSGTPIGADFIDVYAAGVMVWRGQAAAAYNWVVHSGVEQSVAGYASPYFGWHYPPPFLAVAALVATVPYLWALALYMAATFAGYWAVTRRIAPRTKEAFWALAAFPGVFANVGNGQNGFITTALFGAGLLALENSPWLAGALFGLLSYKPQFFVVIPFVLAIGGYGRAFVASLASALACAALSWAAFGTAVWQAFFKSTTLTRHIVLEQGATGWQKIQSVFSMTRLWGGGIEAAYAAQTVVAVCALASAAWIWRKPASFATRAAALCAAMLLTTPYLLDYDLVILAVPLAFLARQGSETGFRPYEKIILVALWLLPLLARSWGTVSLPITPPLLVALMGLCLARTRSHRQATA